MSSARSGAHARLQRLPGDFSRAERCCLTRERATPDDIPPINTRKVLTRLHRFALTGAPIISSDHPMKRLLLVVTILAVTLGRAFSQSPTVSITGPTAWTPGTSITLSVNLTYTGFNAVGLSYWLETNNALASFLTITNLSHFTFPVEDTPDLIRLYLFRVAMASRAQTWILEGWSLIRTESVPPGSYHITDITFSLAAGAPVGMYTLRTSTESPHASEVSDH